MMVVCEQAIIAQDRTLSVIRIIDTLTLPHAPPEGSEGIEIPAIRLAMLVKKGESSGPFELKLLCVDPAGKREMIGFVSDAKLEGPTVAGQELVVPLRLPNGGEGLYWFELLANESLIARTPVSLKFGTGKPDESTDKK